MSDAPKEATMIELRPCASTHTFYYYSSSADEENTPKQQLRKLKPSCIIRVSRFFPQSVVRARLFKKVPKTPHEGEIHSRAKRLLSVPPASHSQISNDVSFWLGWLASIRNRCRRDTPKTRNKMRLSNLKKTFPRLIRFPIDKSKSSISRKWKMSRTEKLPVGATKWNKRVSDQGVKFETFIFSHSDRQSRLCEWHLNFLIFSSHSNIRSKLLLHWIACFVRNHAEAEESSDLARQSKPKIQR